MATEDRIVLRQVNKPSKADIDELSDWFCKVFDLSGKNDPIEPEMFKQIVTMSIKGVGVTSKDLNKELGVPRSTVIYHLNQFIYTGMVVRKGRKYYLRSEDMKSTMESMQADMEREFVRLIEFAGKMDQLFEVKTYGRKRSRK